MKPYRSLATLLVFSSVLAGCGGGGDSGPVLDAPKESRRIGALTQAALDFGSIFLPITSAYLEDRAGLGTIACPDAGSFAVTSAAAGAYQIAYADCDVGWTVLAGSIGIETDGADLLTTFDLTFGGVHYEGAFKQAGAASGASGLRIVRDHATLTPSGGPSFDFEPEVVLLPSGSGQYSLSGHISVFLDPASKIMSLTADGTHPPHVTAQALDGAGNFVRIGTPIDGTFVYGVRNETVWVGTLTNTAAGFSVVFDNEATHQTGVGSATATWADVLAHPLYDPTE